MEKSNPNFLYVSKLRSNSRIFSLSTTHGFTIVELLVVIVVIGILAAITIVSYTGMLQKATVASLTSDLDSASRQLKLYQVTSSVSSYPTSLDINNCPVPADTARCLKPSPGVSYTSYIFNGSITPQGFCLVATKGSTNYKITNDSAPVLGDCQNYGQILNLDAGNPASYPSPFNGTTWIDLSGNSNNGTLFNSVGYISPNINPNDAALVFDGVNDYATVTNPTFLSATDSYSIAVWFMSSGNSGLKFVFEGNSLSSPSLEGNDTGWLFYIGNTSCINIGTTSVGVWYFFVGTFDKSTGVRNAYLNNVSKGTTTNTASNAVTMFNIGSRGAGNNFNGRFSYVSIYNRAISTTESSQLFNNLRGRYGI